MGSDQAPFLRLRAPQIATSRLPSSLPPNHAARNSPGETSTTVEAWQEGNGARSNMNSDVWARTGTSIKAAGITNAFYYQRLAPSRVLAWNFGMLLFSATVFVSAFLLFLVQPMIARIILPWFGGTASVWTTCLMFFQFTLLAGYLY